MRKGLSESEAGKLGAISSKLTYYRRRLLKELNYNENLCRCVHCNSILPYEKRNNKFCSKSCSVSYNNRLRVKKQTLDKPIITKNKSSNKLKKVKYCKLCGSEIGLCKYPEICKNIDYLNHYLNLDLT